MSRANSSRDLSAASPSATPEFSDLYPHRRDDDTYVRYSEWDHFVGNDLTEKKLQRCSQSVIQCIEESPVIRIMLGALESAGCPIELDRHISCEICMKGNNAVLNHGGYDDQENQVFVCANNAEKTGQIHALLAKELLHLFDRCTAKVNYTNIDHLACTEVKKANLVDCSLGDFVKRGNFGQLASAHGSCVRAAAANSLTVAKFIPPEVAKAAIDRVFNRCYADLEPYGRRFRNLQDFTMAKDERYLFGYS